MTEIERIEEIRFFLKFNKKTFSEVLGYAYAQNYTNFLAGNSKLSIKMLKGLKNYDPNISIDWILTGQGQMFVNNNSSSNIQSIKNNDGTVSQVNNGNSTIITAPTELELLKKDVLHLEKENKQLKKALEDKEEIIRLLKR